MTVKLGTAKASGNFLIPHEICLLNAGSCPTHTMGSYLKALIYFTFLHEGFQSGIVMLLAFFVFSRSPAVFVK